MSLHRLVGWVACALALVNCGESGDDAKPGSGGRDGAGAGGAGGDSAEAGSGPGSVNEGGGGAAPASGGSGDAGEGSGAVGQGGQAGAARGDAGNGGVAQVGGAAGAGGVAELCGDTGDLSAEELLASIDTVVVLVMEGRSFDHYLGSLSLLEGKSVNGLTGSESNPDPDEVDVGIHELTENVTSDPPTDWDSAHAQWNQGSNDGFVTAAAGPDQEEVMGYYTRDSLPVTYALADGGVVCDAWFSSLLGPTWPNRFYLHGATSDGEQANLPNFAFTSIFDLLDDAGISAENYYSDLPWCLGAYNKLGEPIDEFFAAAEAGTLPQFSFIDPQFTGEANDDHPGHDIALGQALIATVFAALANSPQWSSSLFVITYAQPGGFFDHVPPPTAVDELTDFQQLGFRVPTIVAGPFVNPGCVHSTTLEHVSIIKTLSVRFGLPSLNARVDATEDLSGLIHAPYLDDPQPPPVLPPAPLVVQEQQLAAQPALKRLVERGTSLGAIQAIVIDE